MDFMQDAASRANISTIRESRLTKTQRAMDFLISDSQRQEDKGLQPPEKPSDKPSDKPDSPNGTVGPQNQKDRPLAPAAVVASTSQAPSSSMSIGTSSVGQAAAAKPANGQAAVTPGRSTSPTSKANDANKPGSPSDANKARPLSPRVAEKVSEHISSW